VADLAAFAGRLLRFDRAALVRVKAGRAWGKLPWGVLVSVPASGPDAVYSAGDGSPQEAQWRVSLPPAAVRVVEVVPASALAKAAAAAARTLREMTGRAGERAIRDALLDHVVITGTSDVDGTAFTVAQRLVQGLVRMNLLGDSKVDVVMAGPWTGLVSPVGQAWVRENDPLSIRPIVNQLKGH
jgi:hypothetical protein